MTKTAPLSDRLSYSVRETAQLIGCGYNTVYGLIETGKLAVVRIGRRRFVRREEIARFLAEAEGTPVSTGRTYPVPSGPMHPLEVEEREVAS